MPDRPATPWLAELRRLLRTRLGVELSRHRVEGVLGSHVLAEARAAGASDPAAWLAHVASPAGEAAWQRLLESAVVGETFFHRHPEQLRAVVAAARDAFAREGRPLAVWSAGCATGEEAWTAAVLLAEAGVPATVLGTDVHADAVRHARAAAGYSDRSAGHLPAALRARWLAREPDGWRVVRPASLGVGFAVHNLATDPAPRAPTPDGRFDVVLCRNVLLYFPDDVVRAVVGRLLDALSADGCLWVGPADLLPTDLVLAHRAVAHGERVLRRRAGSVPRPPSSDAAPTAARVAPALDGGSADEVARLLARGLVATAAELLERRVAASPLDGEAWVALAGVHLARQDARAALDALGRAEAAVPRPPGLDYLRGVASQRAGRPADAEAAFLAAVDADPDDWAAALAASLLARRAGRTLQEEVLLERAQPALDAEHPTAPDHGASSHLVEGVHRDPVAARRAVSDRLRALGVVPPPRVPDGAVP